MPGILFFIFASCEPLTVFVTVFSTHQEHKNLLASNVRRRHHQDFFLSVFDQGNLECHVIYDMRNCFHRKGLLPEIVIVEFAERRARQIYTICIAVDVITITPCSCVYVLNSW